MKYHQIKLDNNLPPAVLGPPVLGAPVLGADTRFWPLPGGAVMAAVPTTATDSSAAAGAIVRKCKFKTPKSESNCFIRI